MALAIWLWFNYGATIIAIPEFTIRTLGILIGILVAAILLTAFVLKKIMGIGRMTETLVRSVMFLAIGPLGAVASLVHLLIFDRLFLRDGSQKSFDEAS